jgi:hypothetical protein
VTALDLFFRYLTLRSVLQGCIRINCENGRWLVLPSTQLVFVYLLITYIYLLHDMFRLIIGHHQVWFLYNVPRGGLILYNLWLSCNWEIHKN